ncbi:competence protein ComK [Oceanobacillus salinisoli]|uniref:competence protein ComK n=1 Tax=Oceanobacillus salinisoli TaxID=2678611 RepID=UPI0012E225BB
MVQKRISHAKDRMEAHSLPCPPFYSKSQKGVFPYMKEILSHYSIHKNTISLLPAKHIDYYTIVLEQNRYIYVKQTPIEIIKNSCLNRYTTYEGVREAVYHYTGFKRKVPIPINPHQNIYFFPTHATNDYECCWISCDHVLQINQTTKSSSSLTFNNGKTIQFDVSTYSLKKQMQRTLECMYSYMDSQLYSTV